MDALGTPTGGTRKRRGPRRAFATFLVAGLTAAALWLGLPAGASANHQGYCGHGNGYTASHWSNKYGATYSWRLRYVTGATYGLHYHLYDNQLYACWLPGLFCSWVTQNQVWGTCPYH